MSRFRFFPVPVTSITVPHLDVFPSDFDDSADKASLFISSFQ